MVKDYSKGKVYKIVCNITGQIYIGSTCVELLSHRLREHTYACKAFLSGKRTSNTSSYKIIVGNDYYIELLENYPCRSNDELIRKEREFYDLYDCINTLRPFVFEDEFKEETKRASSEWYLKNRELVIERSKTHYEENKESISETRKASYQKNKESIKQDYLLNKESILAKKKIHRDANRDMVNAMKLANYHKNKNKVKISIVKKDVSVI